MRGIRRSESPEQCSAQTNGLANMHPVIKNHFTQRY